MRAMEASITSLAGEPVYRTDLGILYNADCLTVMRGIPDDSVDVIFADPPFNLSKNYGTGISDSLGEREYLEWCRAWLDECCRILAPGGSLFVYNIPKWLTYYTGWLNEKLTFRHWIAISIKFSLPIQGRLYPAHYGMLYYVKGPRPKVFNRPRLPIQICRHCGGDIKDYGGHKKALNPNGINLSDVWDDIPPVRHKKYKNRGANQLAPKLLERVLDIATNRPCPGEEPVLVFDPFGGSGTTYYVAQKRGLRWIGTEIGDCTPIVERLEDVLNGRDVDWQESKPVKNLDGTFSKRPLRKRKPSEAQRVVTMPTLPLGDEFLSKKP